MRRVRSLIGRSGHYVPTIHRRCPESDASTLTTISVALGCAGVEGESVYQPSEVDLAKSGAILVGCRTMKEVTVSV